MRQDLTAYGFGWGNPVGNVDKSGGTSKSVEDYDPNSFGAKIDQFIGNLPDIPQSVDDFAYGVARQSTFNFGFGYGTAFMHALRGRGAPDENSTPLKYGERLAFGLAIADVTLNVAGRSVPKLVSLAKNGTLGETLGNLAKGLNKGDVWRYGMGGKGSTLYGPRLAFGPANPKALPSWLSEGAYNYARHVDFGSWSLGPLTKGIGAPVFFSDLLTNPADKSKSDNVSE